MQLGPTPMLEVEHVAALHPDALADGRERSGKRVWVRRANRDRVGLPDRVYAHGLDSKITELFALVRRPQEVAVGRIEREKDVKIAVRLVTDRLDRTGHMDACCGDLESRRVVDVSVLVRRLAACGLGDGLSRRSWCDGLWDRSSRRSCCHARDRRCRAGRCRASRHDCRYSR